MSDTSHISTTPEALRDLRNDIKRENAAERFIPQDQGVDFQRDDEPASR